MVEWDGPRVLPAQPDDAIDLDLIDTGAPASGTWSGRYGVLALVVVIAVLAGVRVADAAAPRGRAYVPTPPVATSAPAEPDTTAFVGELGDLALPAPAGATSAPAPGGSDGRLTIEQAATTVTYDGDAVRYLRSLDLERAAAGAWSTPEYAVVVVVAQFATEREAFLWRMQEQGFSTGRDGLRDAGAVPGLAGTHLFQVQPPRSGVWTSVVYLSRGDVGVLLTVHTRGGPDPGRVADLARRQYGLLP